MVARDPSATRSLPLAPLKTTSEEEEKIIERGESKLLPLTTNLPHIHAVYILYFHFYALNNSTK